MNVVLITGGTKGIGKGISEIFAKNNYSIIGVYLSDKDNALKYKIELENKYSIKIHLIKADISKKSECERVVLESKKVFGKIDVLINNAGQLFRKPNESDKIKIMETKLNAIEYLCDMVKNAEIKSIVNISSLYCESNEGAPFSTAIQCGVESLTKYFAQKYNGEINVNCLRPGVCNTEMLSKNFNKEEINKFIASTPRKKLIEPIEIGECVYALANNNLYTGNILTADAGYTLRSVSHD